MLQFAGGSGLFFFTDLTLISCQVLLLAHSALEMGIGEPSGGLKQLKADCYWWMGAFFTRVWPTRDFAALPQ